MTRVPPRAYAFPRGPALAGRQENFSVQIPNSARTVTDQHRFDLIFHL